MATQDEQLRILKMIQDGKISAEEGAALLATATSASPAKPAPVKMPKQFRIVVTDLQTGQLKVNMSMPWSLLSMGIKMGARFAQHTIHLQDLKAAAESGAEGKVVDIVDQDANERVEVFVE